MYRLKPKPIALAACLLLLVLIAAFMSSGANASLPAKVTPHINDPLHHLSGVVAVPPSTMGLITGSGFYDPDASLVRSPKTTLRAPLVPPVFGPNVDASLNNPANQNETTVAIDPTNSQRVISSANDYRANLQPWVYLSTDGGTNWTNYQVPGTGSLYYGDPAMAFDRGNYAYFSYLGYTGICQAVGGMYASRSTDGGTTFSPPIQLAANTVAGGVAVFHDKEYIAVDDNPASPHFGNVYVGWTKFVFTSGAGCGNPDTQLAAPVVLSRSTDHGITWSTPITASQPISNNNQGTVPVVGLNGEVYVYYVGAATQSQLYYDSVLFSRSTDGGQTFPFFTRVSDLVDPPSPLPPTNFRNNPFGAMAADKQVAGFLYLVWTDYRTNDADILLSRSTDNGNTWSAPQRVNDDLSGNGKDQFFPWIAASPDGSIHIGWLDRREDPNNRNYKEYYTVSYDHGATWEPNIAVSSAPSNPGTSAFIGDYTGLAAAPGVVIPSWTDIRTGTNQNAYVARGVYTPGPTVTPTQAATNTPTRTPTLPPTATPTSCAIQFTDVDPSHTFYPFIRCLACRNIISGYTTGCPSGNPCFRPENNVTRGQVAKIVSNAAGFSDPIANQSFEDVPVGSTFHEFVGRLAMRGIVGGYACGGPGEPCVPPLNLPYFRPNANVTRGQLAKMDSEAAGYSDVPSGQQFEDVAQGSTFYTYTYRLAIRTIMSGYACGGTGEPCNPPLNLPYFRPGNPATRGQTAKIVANTFYPNCNTPQR